MDSISGLSLTGWKQAHGYNVPIMFKRNLIFALMAALLVLALPAPGAAANDRYAAFVVDQDTGVVMHSRRSDAQRHPASLTKMMTLYMMFEAIELGEVGLQDQIRVSARAASAPPSRLGLSAGDTITVEDAILALVVKSANDVALAVGERLAGGEARFAEQMTAWPSHCTATTRSIFTISMPTAFAFAAAPIAITTPLSVASRALMVSRPAISAPPALTSSYPPSATTIA